MKNLKWMGFSLVVCLLILSVQSCNDDDVACVDAILGNYTITMNNFANEWTDISIEAGLNETEVNVKITFGSGGSTFDYTGTLNDNCSVINIPLSPALPFVTNQLNSGIIVFMDNEMTGIFNYDMSEVVYLTAEK